jgi:hypothetical protein
MRSKILKQLGYDGQAIDNQLSHDIDVVITQVSELSLFIDCKKIDFDGQEINFKGASITEFLKGCQSGYLFAATLGQGADRMIKKASYVSTSRQLLLNVACNVLLESLIDQWFLEVKEDLTPRFSPGYGDFSLDYNHVILSQLNNKSLGIEVTELGLLKPSKSVIGVIGIGGSGTYHPCDSCLKRMDCDKKICKGSYE